MIQFSLEQVEVVQLVPKWDFGSWVAIFSDFENCLQ